MAEDFAVRIAEVAQERVVEGLRALGDGLRRVADSGVVGEVAWGVSDRVHGLADWLDLHALEDLLHRRPSGE
jgi:hypothetical protein